ncbi:MAG: hypothetical protein AAFZ07_23395 [Actinomycetota bacterium]
MDPLSVGAAVAVLAGTKGVEKLGGLVAESGWRAVGQALGRLRQFFADTDEDASARLEKFVSAGDASEDSVVAVGELIDDKLRSAPKVRTEVELLIAEARADDEIAGLLAAAAVPGGLGQRITQIAIGNDNIQVGQVGGDVTIDVQRPPR